MSGRGPRSTPDPQSEDKEHQGYNDRYRDYGDHGRRYDAVLDKPVAPTSLRLFAGSSYRLTAIHWQLLPAYGYSLAAAADSWPTSRTLELSASESISYLGRLDDSGTRKDLGHLEVLYEWE